MTVPYGYVMAYLAQRTGYSVTPKDRQEDIQSETETAHQKTGEPLMEVAARLVHTRGFLQHLSVGYRSLGTMYGRAVELA